MTRWAIAALAATIGCGQTVYLGDTLVAPVADAGEPDAGGPDAGPRDGGRTDGGVHELTGRYQLVFQREPSRVLCGGDLELLADDMSMRDAFEAGLDDGNVDILATGETIIMSGAAAEAAFGRFRMVFTRDMQRPIVFFSTHRGSGSGPGDTDLTVIFVQMEVSDPGSGVLHGTVQHKFEDPARSGECLIDYQLTLYNCGVGC